MIKKNILLLFFISSLSVTAQTKKGTGYYITNEISAGNYFGVDLGFNYIYKDSYSARISFSGNIRRPVSQPEDYSRGIESFFGLGTANPYDHFLTYKLDVGKIYYLNTLKTLRANISVGVGYTILKEPNMWQPVGTFLSLNNNYTYSYRSYNTMSLIINPKLEILATSFFGATVSPMVQINKDRIYVGVGVGYMLGVFKNEEVEVEENDLETE